MGRTQPTHLVVGVIKKAHGIGGEVYVWPLTDHPEGVFSPGVVLLSGGDEHDNPDPDRPPLRVDNVRTHQNGFLVHFGGVRTRNEAEALRGTWLFQEFDALAPLDEGEVFYHELLQLDVRLPDGQTLGSVQEVYEMQPSDMLEVRTPSGVVLIPFNADVVTEVDVEGGFLSIDPPEGLLDLEG